MQFQLVRPCGFIETGDGAELLLGEVQAIPVDFAVRWANAKRLVNARCFTFNPVNHPSQHAHVFTVARPDKLARCVFAEPVGAEDGWLLASSGFDFFANIEPMLEVVAHVVAAECDHGKRVATHHALLASDGCCCLRTHGCGHVNAFNPIATL